jgi:hypothetical protein
MQAAGRRRGRPRDRLGLLLTFEIEIPVSHRVVFRQIIAILASPDRPPVEISHWLAFGAAEHAISRGSLGSIVCILG